MAQSASFFTSDLLLGLSQENNEDHLALLYLGGGLDSLAISRLPLGGHVGEGIEITTDHSETCAFLPLFDMAKSESYLISVSITDVSQLRVLDTLFIPSGAVVRALYRHPVRDMIFVVCADGAVLRVGHDRGEFGTITEVTAQQKNDKRAVSISSDGLAWDVTGNTAVTWDKESKSIQIYVVPLPGLPWQPCARRLELNMEPDEVQFIPNQNALLVTANSQKDNRSEVYTVILDRSQEEVHAYVSSRLDFDSRVIAVKCVPQGDYLAVLREANNQTENSGYLDLASINPDNGQLLVSFTSNLKDYRPTDIIWDATGHTVIISFFEKEYGGGLSRGLLDFRFFDRGANTIQSTNFVLTMPPRLYQINVAQ